MSDEESLRLPPHSIEAEQSVLGALLIDNAVAERVRPIVGADDFYSGAHREIFVHVERLLTTEQPADVVTVAESLERAGKLEYVGGTIYLKALFDGVPSAANAAHYAGIVAERSRLRAIASTASELADAALSPAATSTIILQDAQERIEGLARPCDEAGPRPLDLAAMATATTPERRFRVGKIMPIGAPGLWSGHGGAGKTQTAIHLAICLALERPFFGEDVIGARVAYVSTEDDAADLHYRLAQQVRTLGAAIDELDGRLFLYDYSGIDPVLMTAAADGKVVPTPRYAMLRSELRRHGVHVVFLDNLATLCAVDGIKPGHATQAVGLCARLVPEDGNAILIAHVDKATAKAGHSREAYSGTAAFHNRARWRWYLFAPNRRADADVDDAECDEDDGRRLLEVQKVNAGRSGTRIPLRILDNGAVAPDGADDGIVAAIERRNERQAVLASIAEAEQRGMRVPAARSGPSTAYDVLRTMPSFPDALRGKAGKSRLLALVMQMRADGDVITRELTTDARHKREFLFPAQVRE